jgi:hypothetical protein
VPLSIVFRPDPDFLSHDRLCERCRWVK